MKSDLETFSFTLQKPLRIDRRHTAAAGGCDRLAVDVILNTAASEHAGKENGTS